MVLATWCRRRASLGGSSGGWPSFGADRGSLALGTIESSATTAPVVNRRSGTIARGSPRCSGSRGGSRGPANQPRHPATPALVESGPGAERPATRYLLLGGKVGLPTRGLYLRALVGAALWLGAPPLAARLLARLGARDALHRLERRWARGVARHLRRRLELAGLEHLDPRRSYVVAPLHEGCADPLALLHLPLKLRFVVRDEFLAWRLLGPYLRDTGQLAIRPEEGAHGYRALRRAAPAVVAAGESLVVFPQGSILGIETDFLPGAFALARALGHPLLPIALTGGHRVWEHPYTPRLRYGQRVSLRVLPPVPEEECLARPVDELRREVQRRPQAGAAGGAGRCTATAPRGRRGSRQLLRG